MCRPRLPSREPKATTPPPPPVASPDEKQAALESHRLLHQSLVTLQRKLLGRADDDTTSKLLAESLQHSQALSTYLSATIEPVYYAAHIPAHSTTPHRALAIPELFELILDYLPIPDILAVYQTCKEYKLRIDNSDHIQTRLCLRPAPAGSNFRMPFKKCLVSPDKDRAGFYCKPSTTIRNSIKYTDEGRPKISITAVFRALDPEQKVPPIGATYQRMFVTQPPVTTLTPWTRCCALPLLLQPFVREDGITLGDLHVATRDLIEKHRFCPHAPQRSLIPENGENRVQMAWKGEVVLEERDPIVVRGKREMEAREEERRTNELRSRKMREYWRVKREAHEAGQPIPTMQQWLDANPAWNQGEEKPLSTEEHLAIQGMTIPNDAFSFN